MAELISRLSTFPETIFSTMTRLAQERGAVNLGQGFPDDSGPESMLTLACEHIHAGNNQYSPGRGFSELRTAVANDRLRTYGQNFNPNTEVLITVGATEALTASILAFTEPGDEVILIEPYYDSYAAAIALAGGSLVPVSLLPDLRLDTQALEKAITERTRIIIINTPHNPSGMMLNKDELEAIAALAHTHDLLVISDEVYEKFPFGSRTHIPIATLDGMKERTITISSAAKMLNCTGWKTGWALATPEHINAILMVKQYLSFVGTSPVQPAIAHALNTESEWIHSLKDELEDKYTQLSQALREAGLKPLPTEGGYFVLADCGMDAQEFCLGPLLDAGIVGIPVTSFISSDIGQQRFKNIVRFAFCRSRKTIDAAIKNLEKLK